MQMHELGNTTHCSRGRGQLGCRSNPDEALTRLTPRPRSPMAMWALTGMLRSDDIKRQLDVYHDVGWGVVLYPRWGLEVEYLSNAWFERIRFMVEQAAARGMEVWLYDEFCWPSGHAGGLVSKGHEDLAAQLLHVEADGKSRVTQVPGSANLLLRDATRKFLQVTHDRYADAVSDYFGRCVRAIFTDEPSLPLQHRDRRANASAWELLWSADLDAALGGDFRERLASQSDVVNWSGWREYWAAYADVFHDSWTAPVASWCREHGLASTGHFLREDSFGGQVAANGSLRRQLNELDIPGIDEIRTRVMPEDCEALTFSAIAELPGRERMAELFALGPPYMAMGQMVRMVDLCTTCGIDRFVVATCPCDLRGVIFKPDYLGVYGIQQPWFREFAREFTSYVSEAAERAYRAEPLGVTWPTDEELWAEAGPAPMESLVLRQMTERVVSEARSEVRARLTPGCGYAFSSTRIFPLEAVWTFHPADLNSLRLETSTLTLVDLPQIADLSVQSQLVKELRINGVPVNWHVAPEDLRFDLSYRRVSVISLLRQGENRVEVELTRHTSLKFLPALILWGDFAVDNKGCLVAPPQGVPLGDWRRHGYPEFCGTGCYQACVEFAEPPAYLKIDTGGYPASVTVNGEEAGRRPWAPFRFDLCGLAGKGHNGLQVKVTSTLGHLFVPDEAPAIGLLGAWAGS